MNQKCSITDIFEQKKYSCIEKLITTIEISTKSSSHHHHTIIKHQHHISCLSFLHHLKIIESRMLSDVFRFTERSVAGHVLINHYHLRIKNFSSHQFNSKDITDRAIILIPLYHCQSSTSIVPFNCIIHLRCLTCLQYTVTI